MSTLFVTFVTILLLLAPDAAAQQSTQASTRILGYEIQGINSLMTAEEARAALLGSGFSEKDGESWGKVPTASFNRDDSSVAITHRESVILRIVETRIARAESLDYSADLERIQQHFSANDDAGSGCVVLDYGARCGFRDADPNGARFNASLAPEMIFIQQTRNP